MKDVIILGRGPSLSRCRYDSENIWACSSVLSEPNVPLDKITRVFAVDTVGEGLKKDIELAKEKHIQVVSNKSYTDIPYPEREIKRKYYNCYLRITVSYMIALAIEEGYELINLYGVDQGPEYLYVASKPYVTYWVGVCDALGIKLISNSQLLFDPFFNVIISKDKMITIDKSDVYSKVRLSYLLP